MKIEKPSFYCGNFNYKYEWHVSGEKWSPCHIYEECESYISIYCTNGAVISLNKNEVREMSMENRRKLRLKIEEDFAECIEKYGIEEFGFDD